MTRESCPARRQRGCCGSRTPSGGEGEGELSGHAIPPSGVDRGTRPWAGLDQLWPPARWPPRWPAPAVHGKNLISQPSRARSGFPRERHVRGHLRSGQHKPGVPKLARSPLLSTQAPSEKGVLGIRPQRPPTEIRLSIRRRTTAAARGEPWTRGKEVRRAKIRRPQTTPPPRESDVAPRRVCGGGRV